jgi:hypothetical protein
MWQRQALWNKRVEFYSELWDSMIRFGAGLNEVSAQWQSANSEAGRGHEELTKRAQEAFKNLLDQQTRVIANQTRARLFAGPKLDALLSRLPDAMGISEDSYAIHQVFNNYLLNGDRQDPRRNARGNRVWAELKFRLCSFPSY